MTGALGAGTLAGCLSSPFEDDDSGDLSGSASFFALEDWGNHIGGDVISFASPVSVGEMGHGWDPDADIVPEIAQHDVFLYLGTPEFQWSIDVANELDSEDDDIVLIDGMEAISAGDFLPFVSDGEEVLPEPDYDVTFDPDSMEIASFDIIMGDEVVSWWHDNHWHGGIPDIPLESNIELQCTIEDADGHVLPLGHEEQFAVEASIEDNAPHDLLTIDSNGETINLSGVETGQTLLIFELYAGEEVVFDTTHDPATATVVEAEDMAIDAFHDPHVWVDPIHVSTIVEHIATELGEHFPDHESNFEENTAAYSDQLDMVHREFNDLTSRTELDVAVLVAHNAFQYIEDRYGFELRTPVGVTPDAAESIEDIAVLGQTIQDFGIDTILYDPFEAPNPNDGLPQAAEILIEDTDATTAEPLSATEGITPEWQDEGYGWVELMTEVNIPALEKALKAE